RRECPLFPLFVLFSLSLWEREPLDVLSGVLPAQLLGKQLLYFGPRVFGRNLVVGRSLVTEETVLSARVDHNLMADLVFLQLRADGLGLRQRDRRVLLTKEAQAAAGDFAGAAECGGSAPEPLRFGDAAPVEAGRRLDLGLTSSQIGHMTTDAKSHGADLITLDKILPFEERERRAGIGDQLI